MSPNNRILLNTVSQYGRAVFNTVLSLYSTRIILKALGMSDFGIYAIVGGVVALLGFITNALITTTQRYSSYYHGKSDLSYVSRIFGNSLFLHVLVALVLSAVLLLLQKPVFDGVLNIDIQRKDTAVYIYYLTVLMLSMTIVTAPFKALCIANENIVYISIIEMLDGIMRLITAFALLDADMDKLLLYGVLMFCISVLNLFAFAVFTLTHYRECHILGIAKDIDRGIISRLTGFAGWTTYGMGAIVLRNQGIALIINHFLGTVVNAAYGIANQLFGSVSIIATSVINAINPQLMQAEGNGNRPRMLMLAERESKFSTMLLMIVLIPVIFEMPSVLRFWLRQYSMETVMLCRYIFVAFIFDQMTYGLNTANQALGRIRNYCLLAYTPKLLIIPIAWILFHNGLHLQHVMCVYLIIEILVSIFRIPYIKYTAGLSMVGYVKNVYLPLFPLLLVQCFVGYMCISYIQSPYRFLITIAISIVMGAAAAFFFTINRGERQYLLKTINNVMTRLHR